MDSIKEPVCTYLFKTWISVLYIKKKKLSLSVFCQNRGHKKCKK